ncbi:MAG: hypothetical protein E7462_05835 [Ruminococcaceae bacterium]|nr:hypothetical protein [Oscillospiraceae bacterium]
MERDLIAHGVVLGQYDFPHDEIMNWIDERIIGRGLNLVKFDTVGKQIEKELLFKWIRHMVDNEIYFIFSHYYGRGDMKGKVAWPVGFDNETAAQVKELGGKYFLGMSASGELGSEYACAGSGYWPNKNNSEHMKDAYDQLCTTVEEYFEPARMGQDLPITSVEATAMMPYISRTLTFPTVETPCGNPEFMIPMLRATAKTIKAPYWSTYVAHEWYAGVRNKDPLKWKRWRMLYNYCYMSGSNIFVLESGDERIYSHEMAAQNGAEGVKSSRETPYTGDYILCQKYRQALKDFSTFIREDFRPKGGPKVKVAFVQGNLDAYSPWRSGSAMWNNYNDKNFGYSTPEFVWRLFDEITVKRNWADIHNFGDIDLSGAPAYGTYDIINAADGYETMSRYDYLIFTGWNTMTEEIYENLKKFVQNGGRLFMTAAHLNTTDKRDGEMKLIHDGDVSDLFGCVLDAENTNILNHGYKFLESLVPEFKYPADMWFDPLFSEGYVKYPTITLKGAQPTGKLSQDFDEKDVDAMPIWMTENKVGDGYAVLMTSLDYPSMSGYTIYKAVVREMLTASHRQCPIKVYGGDKLRFTVYEGDKVYLLNTDFDCQTHAIIDYGTEKREFFLQPGELKPVER